MKEIPVHGRQRVPSPRLPTVKSTRRPRPARARAARSVSATSTHRSRSSGVQGGRWSTSRGTDARSQARAACADIFAAYGWVASTTRSILSHRGGMPRARPARRSLRCGPGGHRSRSPRAPGERVRRLDPRDCPRARGQARPPRGSLRGGAAAQACERAETRPARSTMTTSIAAFPRTASSAAFPAPRRRRPGRAAPGRLGEGECLAGRVRGPDPLLRARHPRRTRRRARRARRDRPGCGRSGGRGDRPRASRSSRTRRRS